MKILFLTTEDSTFWSHRLALARAIKKEGIEVVIMTRSGEYCSRLEDDGFRIVPWHISRRSLNLFREIRSLLQVVRVYRAERPELVHHVALKPVVYGGIAARCLGDIPVVNTVTGMGLVFASSSLQLLIVRRVLSLLLKWVCGFTNSKMVVQNDDDHSFLVNQRITPSARTVIIPGFGVNTAEFAPTEEPVGTPVVVLPSRMLWEKGVREFVAAAKELRMRQIPVRMVLVGAPDPHNKGCIPEAQLDVWVQSGDVEWWGRQNDMKSVFARSSLVCLPSYREGVPKVLMEAAACGRAIVTTIAPGCSYVVRNGENGLLVPIRDSRSLADAISTLVQNSALRKQMAARGRRRALCEFSQEKITAQILEIYADLLRGKWRISEGSTVEKEIFARS